MRYKHSPILPKQEITRHHMTSSKLRQLRRKHEISLQQVADAMGKSRMTVCRWEAGKIQNKAKILSDYKAALEGLIRLKP